MDKLTCKLGIPMVKKKYNHSILISFDVQGAFDRIKWSSLLKTLEKLGIEKNLVEIIQSYLLQRKVGHYDQNNKLILQTSFWGASRINSLSNPFQHWYV